MRDLITLRKVLDEHIGPARRAAFFEGFFSHAASRLPVLRSSSLAEAEHVAQALRYADIPAGVEQTELYPNLHTVWVTL